MSATTKTRLTAEDLENLPDGKSYELIDGELVERVTWTEANWIVAVVCHLLMNHCLANRLGWVFESECGYQCFPDDPDGVRKPDVSFVRAGRFPGGWPPRKGFLKFAPDLAVEVVSPNDLASEVDKKVKQFLGAGVRLVWVVNPETREVRVHRADRTITGLGEQDELTGDDVIPGFRCQVSDFFVSAEGPEVPPPASA